MVAAWGGYIFVLNMVGVHAGILVLLGRFSYKLHHAYTLFFVVGTLGALQVPVVGWAPFKSAEQLGPFGIFLLMQVLFFIEKTAEAYKMTSSQKWAFAFKVFAAAATVGVAGIAALYPTGYFGPLSVRIRSLFVEHTKTGNMLVDSVAEHQPASPQAYWQYLHYGTFIGPPGFLLCFVERTDSKYFLICYAVVAYYFSNRMVRLIIIMGPITSALGGVLLANVFDWTLYQFVDINDDGSSRTAAVASGNEEAEQRVEDAAVEEKKEAKGKKDEKKKPSKETAKTSKERKQKKEQAGSLADKLLEPLKAVYESLLGRTLRKITGLVSLWLVYSHVPEFHEYCHHLARAMSQPSIVFKAQLHSGESVIVDDYLRAYEWVRDNTAEDARILAWWDYGYQITGVANRTSIADGNTWSLEHIALLARSLTSEEKKGHRIIKHLADYVLVWTGGGGDDVAKSPHLARIANSIYKGTCSDPHCSQFGFDRGTRSPTRMMRNSVLYKLHSNGLQPGVEANPQLWTEVYQSKYGKVRIYKVLKVSKESKKWAKDPSNRSCDAPGSWYCVGHYPPALEKLNRKFLGLTDPDAAVTEDDDNSYSL
jgi:dolichyl-diphosphooligosaccharide--protein glycosyltransferase